MNSHFSNCLRCTSSGPTHGLTHTALFVSIISKSRNLPEVHCTRLAVVCTFPGISMAVIADISESAGSCLLIYGWFKNWCSVFSLIFNDPFPSPALATAIERQNCDYWIIPFYIICRFAFCSWFLHLDTLADNICKKCGTDGGCDCNWSQPVQGQIHPHMPAITQCPFSSSLREAKSLLLATEIC